MPGLAACCPLWSTWVSISEMIFPKVGQKGYNLYSRKFQLNYNLLIMLLFTSAAAVCMDFALFKNIGKTYSARIRFR
jgi:hypothetical protein